jgi:hypothetical protein
MFMYDDDYYFMFMYYFARPWTKFFCEYLLKDEQDLSVGEMLTVYFGTPNMLITLWFGFDYGTNMPLDTLII